MSIPQLTSCCCGCSLKTGTKIIGWVTIISSICLLIFAAIFLAAIFYVENHPLDNTEDAEEIRKHIPALKVLTIIAIVQHLLTCVMSFILLLGAYQNKAKLILFWVVVTLTAAVIGEIMNIMQIFTVYTDTNLILILFFFVELYLILVVYSFYREIQNISTYP